MFRPPDPPVRTRFSPRRSRSSPCGPTYQRHRRAGRRLWPAVRAPTAAEWWCGWPRHGRAVGQGPWTISEWTSPWSPASGRCCAGGWTGIRQRRSVGRPPLRPRVMRRLERTIRPATDVVSEGEPERPAALAGCGAGQPHMPGDAGVGDGCREVALVDEGVMSSAQEGGVREVGRSAPAPPLHVMDVAPLGRDGAAGEGAVPIAVPDGCALGRREETVTEPDVQHVAPAAEHHRDDTGVAGHPAHHGRREEVTVHRQPRTATLLDEVREGDGDDDVGLLGLRLLAR